MARTETAGCLNHQHDRRYCCHHCPWYLPAVYCLTSIAHDRLSWKPSFGACDEECISKMWEIPYFL
jgi:hypothetical protein